MLACVQTDIKRVLAYSTVSQLGYMMAAIGAGFAGAGFLHLLTHGVFKALLFLGAGAVIHAVGSNESAHMGGLARRMPQTAIVFLVGTLSLAGVPLFAGFLSKEEILGAAWAGGLLGPFVLLVVAAFLTAFYMFRVVFLAFFGTPPAAAASPAHRHGHGGVHGRTTRRSSWPGRSGSWPCCASSSGSPRWSSLPRRNSSAPGWLTPLAVAVSGGGIVLAWLTYQRRAIDADELASVFGPIRRAALAKFWIDDVVAGRLSRRPARRRARRSAGSTATSSTAC